MDLLLVDELEAVLDGAQEAVGVGEPVGVVGVDVAGLGQLGRASTRVVGAAELGVEVPVHELQELHGELDVADAAGAALELPVGEPLALDLGLDPGLHRPQRAQVVGLERVGPQPPLGGVAASGRRGHASPPTGRALSSAWNSHGSAHRSQYAS